MLALMLEQTASQLVFSRLTAKSARKWPAPRMAQPLLRLWKALVKRDRAAVVCDLLFGLPGQDAQTWEKIWLLPAISVSTASISMRSMSCPIHRWAKPWKNGRTTVPSPAERRDLYLQGCDFMDDAGWRCISNSHWGRTTRERNLYNLLIKQGADCLAFGSGAGGSINGYSPDERTQSSDLA